MSLQDLKVLAPSVFLFIFIKLKVVYINVKRIQKRQTKLFSPCKKTKDLPSQETVFQG